MISQRHAEQLKNARLSRWSKAPSRQDRFWMSVKKGGPEECWIWKKSLDVGGYGVFWVGDKHMKAHRYSWQLVHGPVDPTLCLDHLCRVRSCVNPAHLEPVTNRINVLRGVSIVAKVASSDKCMKGHSLSDDNCRITPKGHRLCRICEKERKYKYYRDHPDMKIKIAEWRSRWKERNKY